MYYFEAKKKEIRLVAETEEKCLRWVHKLSSSAITNNFVEDFRRNSRLHMFGVGKDNVSIMSEAARSALYRRQRHLHSQFEINFSSMNTRLGHSNDSDGKELGSASNTAFGMSTDEDKDLERGSNNSSSINILSVEHLAQTKKLLPLVVPRSKVFVVPLAGEGWSTKKVRNLCMRIKLALSQERGGG